MASRDDNGPISGLDISLSQTSTSPPKITVKVTNNNDGPATFLSYGSPLDKLALQLGLLSITPAGADSPLDLPIIQVRRVWPPTKDLLITIQAGGSDSNEIELKAPIITKEKVGSSAHVVLKGEWGAVWGKDKDDIDDSSLKDIGSSPDVSKGKYQSPELEISLE